MHVSLKKLITLASLILCITFNFAVFNFYLAAKAAAHVTVKPSEVDQAAFQTFSVGVPNEKDIPTIGLRLVLPPGLHHVSPNVKPGWTITTKSQGEGEEATVTEIEWTGGTIPEGQRDDFLFSAQAPASATTLSWKAYQTYSDGTIASWDQDPSQEMTHEQEEAMMAEGKGPSSQTTVIADLNTESENASVVKEGTQATSVALIFSIAALALAAVAFSRTNKKGKTK